MDLDNKKHFNNTPLTQYFQFGVSVDCVILGYIKDQVKVLLIKRGTNPYKDRWSLPGDLVKIDETLDCAAKRILTELTGLENVMLNQFKAFGAVDRHVQGRVITVAYYSLVNVDEYVLNPNSWADEAQWFDIHNAGELAFDHNDIFNQTLYRFQQRLKASPLVGFELLPKKFTLNQCQQMIEYILEESVDKSNFRKKILSTEVVKELSETQSNVNHRPAKLYAVDESKIPDDEIL